jgi:hypothetical protein
MGVTKKVVPQIVAPSTRHAVSGRLLSLFMGFTDDVCHRSEDRCDQEGGHGCTPRNLDTKCGRQMASINS